LQAAKEIPASSSEEKTGEEGRTSTPGTEKDTQASTTAHVDDFLHVIASLVLPPISMVHMEHSILASDDEKADQLLKNIGEQKAPAPSPRVIKKSLRVVNPS
jgi:hypothetical protein